jgi:FkbM family methyltransferase
MTLQVEYGIESKYKDVTTIVLSHFVNNNHLYIPAGDSVRAKILGDPVLGIVKHIRINGKEIYPHDVEIQLFLNPTLSLNLRQPLSLAEATSNLKQIHQKLKFTGGKINSEYPEQLMSALFIQPDDRVLELGSNIGRNTLTIATLLQDSKQLVTLESDPKSCQILQKNRQLNNYSFHIENSALSARKLVQKGWDTIPSDKDIPGFKEIKTITLNDLLIKYPIKFNVLVADCEGALYYILNDTPNLLDSLQVLIFENDYKNIDHKKFVDSLLAKKGFHRVYAKSGGWGPCNMYFYEVFSKSTK